MRNAQQIATVAVVGLGTIGTGWVAQFAAAGLTVRAFDPDAEQRAALEATVCDMLVRNGQPEAAEHLRLSLHDTLEAAVEGADFVQENVPERQAIKADVLGRLDRALPGNVIIATSTSGLMLSDFQDALTAPARLVVGHPFHPVQLMPLVEVVPGRRTAVETVTIAEAFYTRIGKVAVRLEKEAPGHLVNRLQAALWREAVACVEDGIASVAQVDAAVVNCLGPRWSVVGPHMAFHLGGGKGGLRHFIDQLGPGIQTRWEGFRTPDLAAMTEALVCGVEDEAAGRDIDTLQQERDRKLAALLAHRAG
ncbi:3-hydroxyacyl-CoA dehydrogenase NAD-binding domain-containing protein [Antarcticimicrobium sediminis]|uniref:3-hydroxyacyl-CoA dehydrogenase n=1 Tax=Antarcticimicrobium sediminis TaxID=2546227 RepID=A0A4R5EM25_9RHOB|nr:3-hydroxyacyl-CoA dehydrogenase NAD-binding domain-containing protein [Antarcticimicrobium sediminis]TDE35403.1 3-hydroxyacyl-CoA dehydrogenase [Antarcticimicrobium sediminis]